jgi:AraC family transcriptional regulator
MVDNRQKFIREEYTARINLVIDYIEKNIDKDLSLQEIAKVSQFSPFHFHRIFSAMMQETLNDFIQRLRIEKAASKLLQNPRQSITEVALECGFSGSSAFAKAFKEAFHMSATAWRARKIYNSKISKTDSKEDKQPGKARQESEVYPLYTQGMANQIWRIEMKSKEIKANVAVKEMPEQPVVYARHIGPYKGDPALFEKLITKLMTWAGPRGLLRFPETKLLMVYYDNPNITDGSRLRVDACITVPADTKVSGDIGKGAIPAGKYAVAHFEINGDQYQDAWNAVYGGWRTAAISRRTVLAMNCT